MTCGTAVTFSGPFGSMMLPENKSVPVILLAGGVGVAPFLSMIRFSMETNAGNPITIIEDNLIAMIAVELYGNLWRGVCITFFSYFLFRLRIKSEENLIFLIGYISLAEYLYFFCLSGGVI